MIDQSESDMRVVAGSNKYVMKCNWKLLVENSIDGYHLIPTHNTYLEYLAGLGTQPSTTPTMVTHRCLGQRPLRPVLRGAEWQAGCELGAPLWRAHQAGVC